MELDRPARTAARAPAACSDAPADRERRSFLILLGVAPFTLGSLLIACGSEEKPATPAAPAPAPKPAAPKAEAPPQAEAPKPAPSKPQPSKGGAGSGEYPLVTEVDEMKSMVQALQYVSTSDKPDQNCTNCLFYTEKTANRGTCELFPQGHVEPGGWCASWAMRQGT